MLTMTKSQNLGAKKNDDDKSHERDMKLEDFQQSFSTTIVTQFNRPMQLGAPQVHLRLPSSTGNL